MANNSDIRAFQVRLPADIHARLKNLADEAEVSMNQMIVGILAWASEHGHAGGVIDDHASAVIETSDETQTLWFGSDGIDYDDAGEAVPVTPFIAFVLDFTTEWYYTSPR